MICGAAPLIRAKMNLEATKHLKRNCPLEHGRQQNSPIYLLVLITKSLVFVTEASGVGENPNSISYVKF